MDIPQNQLNDWYETFDALQDGVGTAEEALRAGHTEDIAELLHDLRLVAVGSMMELEGAGAKRPDYIPEPPFVPLHLLDTTANRKYAAVLREAWQCALEVDRERGKGENGPASRLLNILQRV